MEINWRKIRGVLACLLLLASQAVAQETLSADADSASAPLRYPISKNYAENYEDLTQQSPADLPSPENIQTTIQYDPVSGKYYFETTLGEDEMGVPFYLSSEEYLKYTAQQSMQAYYRQKGREEKERKHQFSLTDMKFDIGAADKVFGPGGVQIKLQGSAELIFGLNFKKLKDPSLSERSQNPAPTFDFDEKIQLNATGSVGDKLKFGLNYN
ncbi:MAG: hypothetical protein UFP03_08030, partial [Paludibacteraceae bacterium]|nr:hypothetical protein [Paludibacteraceae bacterium]